MDEQRSYSAAALNTFTPDPIKPMTRQHQADSVLAESPTPSSRRSFLRTALGLSLFGFGARAAQAAGIEDFYKINVRPEAFLAEVFGAAVPPPQVLEVNGRVQLAGQIAPLPGRLRYWRANGRTVWIFDELGKEGYQPTTCGFVVKDKAIEQARVLIYRESRGEQVGESSFLQQLVGARSTGSGIDRPVSNISGATYSVKMMQRMAAMALALDALAA